MDTITNKQLDKIKTILFEKIVDYLYDNGISIDINDLYSNITINNINNIKNVKKSKFKVKPPKFKKPKFKVKNKNDYLDFVNKCKELNLTCFEYYDENNWVGPATKICKSSLDITNNFDKIKTLEGPTFIIIRPIVYLPDISIKYDLFRVNTTSLIPYNSDDETETEYGSETETETEYGSETETESSSETETETEDWYFNGMKYLLDSKNNLYSYNTNEFMGRKISEYKIDFNAEEK